MKVEDGPISSAAEDIDYATAITLPPPTDPEVRRKAELLYQLRYPAFPSAPLFVVLLSACLTVWVFSWLYIGCTWDALTQTKSLEVAVLNCDNGVDIQQLPASYGQPVTAILQQWLQVPLGATLLTSSVWSGSAGKLLKWKNFTCTGRPGNIVGCGILEANCYAELLAAVDHGKVLSALYVPGNFSSNYVTSFVPAAPSKTQLWLQHAYPQGHNYATYGFITKIVTATAQSISLTFGNQVLASVQRANATSLLHPSFLLQPVQLRERNLRPVHRYGQNFATYVYCVLLWLGSAFCVALLYQYKTKAELDSLNDVREISTLEAIVAEASKAGVAIVTMLVQCALLMATLRILGGGQWHHNAGYAIAFAWYMSWSFLAFNGILIHVVGLERFSAVSALIIILQLTSSGGFFSEELSPDFFRIGHGLPFYYGTRGFRTIYFGGLDNYMPENWGVITAWNAAGAILYFVLMVLKLRHKLPWESPIAALSPVNTGGVAIF